MHAPRLPGAVGSRRDLLPVSVSWRRLRCEWAGRRRAAAAPARSCRDATRVRGRAGAAVRRAFDWLQSRTGFRGARHALLDETLPPGTGWFFTLGSVLLVLLGVQLLTGAFLTLTYAPTPDHAYDSIRYIISTTPGRIVRGLHHYGSSFIVIAVEIGRASCRD